MHRYPIPDGEFQHEIEIQRSRFRATVAPACDVDEAREVIQRVRDRAPEACHHCWAYLVGPPGSTDRVGLSDDGEPHGTAGRPMLHVLTHSTVGDVVVVVTRWFGGTKLGTGGLVRAYGDAVQQVLDRMPRTERIEWAEVLVHIDYAGVDPLQRLLAGFEAQSTEERWGERATLRIRLPIEQRAPFIRKVVDMSNGTALIE